MYIYVSLGMRVDVCVSFVCMCVRVYVCYGRVSRPAALVTNCTVHYPPHTSDPGVRAWCCYS